MLLSEKANKCSVLQARITSQLSVWKMIFYLKDTIDFSQHFETMINTTENIRIRGQFFLKSLSAPPPQNPFVKHQILLMDVLEITLLRNVQFRIVFQYRSIDQAWRGKPHVSKRFANACAHTIACAVVDIRVPGFWT